MGLDASVMCNCFRDGKTTPPPFPIEWLEFDNEGCVSLKEEHDSDENWIKEYEWKQSCCEHEGMDFVSAHISNWTGYRLFQTALEQLGWLRFPVLKEQLPNSNGGLTPPLASAKALLELDFFNSAGEIGKKTVLIESSSGEYLHEYVDAYDGVFILSGRLGINVGLSEFDFFAINSRTKDVLFRAKRIRQFTKTGAKITSDGDDIVWQDLDTGKTFESGIAIHGKQIPWEDGNWQQPDGTCRHEYPFEFHVRQQSSHVADFDYIVRALKTVFAASVTVGNPVRWC